MLAHNKRTIVDLTDDTNDAKSNDHKTKRKRVQRKLLPPSNTQTPQSSDGLPVHLWNSEHVLHKCIICLRNFAQGHLIKTLRCMHMFHAHEIDAWFNISPSCPSCRISRFENE